MGDKFSWADEDAVVVKRTDAIAIYANDSGDIVIRQEGDDFHGGQDLVIVVPLDSVEAVINRIRSEADLVKRGG